MSEQTLNELDVYKLAITNELRGASFYSLMAQKSQNPKTKDIFHKLSEEEKEHHKLFTNMLEQVAKNPNLKSLKREAASYIKTLVENSVFPVDIEGLTKTTSPEQALALGIQAEKDSILLYHELFEYAQDESVRNMLHNLLQEEKMHLLELRQQYEELKTYKSLT